MDGVIRRLRLASGLVMLAYVTTHFVNHSLGLISVQAMDRAVVLAAPEALVSTLAADPLRSCTIAADPGDPRLLRGWPTDRCARGRSSMGRAARAGASPRDAGGRRPH